MRLIHEMATTPGEVERRKEEMVRYMAWRSPDTLKAYEHYFQAIHHAQMQDALHQRLDEKLKSYMTQAQQKRTSLRKSTPQSTKSDMNTHVSNQEVGWEGLLAVGGMEDD